MRTLVLIALLLAPVTLFAQKPTDDDEEQPAAGAPSHTFQFKFKDRPSFRIGDDFRLDIKTKFHLDFRHFYPPVTNLPDDSTFLLTRARFGVKGEITKYVEYEFEREMRRT